MEMNKVLFAGVFGMLLIGVSFVGASSYLSVQSVHEKMVASDSFEKMHTAMMSGDFEAAEEYHKNLDFECPMHELVTEGEVSIDEFRVMHEWMMTGDFPLEKPESISDDAWKVHMVHHPEIFG